MDRQKSQHVGPMGLQTVWTRAEQKTLLLASMRRGRRPAQPCGGQELLHAVREGFALRRAARTDSNHAQIRDRLRKLGVFTWNTSQLGNGFPDLLCCIRNHVVLLEVKDPKQPPSKRALTPKEQEFFAAYPGPIFVVTSVEQALQALGLKAVDNDMTLRAL